MYYPNSISPILFLCFVAFAVKILGAVVQFLVQKAHVVLVGTAVFQRKADAVVVLGGASVVLDGTVGVLGGLDGASVVLGDASVA